MFRRRPESLFQQAPSVSADRLLYAAVGLVAVIALLTPIARADSSNNSQADKAPPSSPGPIVLAGATQSSVTLTWIAATDDTAVAEYGVLWETHRLKDAEKTVTRTFTKTGLSCGKSYAVAVVAFDASGNSSRDWSTAVVSTGACLDTSPPSAPTGLTQVAQTDTSATVSWDRSYDDVGVVGYALSKSGVPLGTTEATSYTVGGLTCGSGYTLVVQAYDAAGNRSQPSSYSGKAASCADKTPPTAPTGLQQVGRTETGMSLSWSASADASGVSGYGIYVDSTLVKTVSGTTATVSSLACGKTYSISVDAVDGAGNRSGKTQAQMPTAACPPSSGGVGDGTPPTAPTNVRVTSAPLGSVSLAWNASTDNVGVTGYSVYADSKLSGDTPGTTFLVPSVTCGASVSIGVEARDAAGNRSARSTITVATHPCSDTTKPTTPGPLTLQNKTETSLTVSWTPSTDASGISGYGAYRDGTIVGTAPGTQYTFSGLTCGKTYTLGVDGVDTAGNRSAVSSTMLATAACSDIVPPTTPSGVVASDVQSTTATLAWNASTDNVGVKGYDVYADGTRAATTTSLQTALGGLKCGSVVKLAVEAFDLAGNRSARASTDVTTKACNPPPSLGVLYVAPNGSDAATCTPVAPCASLDRAYRVAAPGDIVSIAAGDYPMQTLRRDTTKTSDVEVIFAASGAVTLSGFWSGDQPKQDSGAQHFELRGVRITAPVRLNWGTEDVTIADVDAPAIEFTSVRDVRVDGGDYGPNVDGISHINACGVSGCYVPEGIVIDGALFHDYTISDPAIHAECLMAWPAKGLTIRNSTFRNCTDFDLLIKPYNTGLVGAPGQILLENNFFDEPIVGEGCLCDRAGSSIGISQGDGESWGDVMIRYNSTLGEIRVDPPITNAVVKGNVGRKEQAYSCQTNVTFDHNVWNGTSCSPTDKTASLSSLFVGGNSSAFDLRLAAGSAAIDAGDPGSYPSIDLFGGPRPLGKAPDSGANERG